MRTLLSVGFTASRELDEQGRRIILGVLPGIPLADRYVTGGCIGGDSFIGRWLFWNRPDAEHVVVVPADRSRVDPWWTWVQPVTLIVMPPGTTYKDRNERLVAESAVVYAFPAYEEEDPRSQRSGTWQAARMARRAQKLSQWHCIRPPFRSWVEIPPGEFGTVSAG